ncbi:hypothetical protein [Saccharospirillum sp.]|uniref:hypothetical protein n=1 Tax=Saccharospirillum sp. TaxID=2033801 RepID=UPI00349FE152
MKDQYFGDINDYRKYGLLRAIIRASGFRVLFSWMLTPDDGSTDGKLISYLDRPDKWACHDPVLFQTLKELLAAGQKRRVSLIEDSGLIPKAEYFSSLVPDSTSGRSAWFSSLIAQAQSSDCIFLDPDNGLEVKSKPYGGKGSSKILYWCEVEALWASGKSLLIYQHFIREKRPRFIEHMLETLRSSTPGSFVEAFSTPHVVFLMALQPEHQEFHGAIVSALQENWAGQIQHWELTRAQQSAPADRSPVTRLASAELCVRSSHGTES